MAVLSMSGMAGASTWVVRAAKLVRSTSVSPGFGGLGVGQVADPEAKGRQTELMGVAGQAETSDIETGSR